MPSRQSSTRSRIRFSVVRPRGSTAADVPRRPTLPWWLASVVGALATLLAGWLVVTGVVVAGWLSAMHGSLTDALDIGTRGWLLAHGTPVTIGASRLTLVPLGISLLLAIALSGVAGYAARQAALARTPKVARFEAGRITLAVGAATGAIYAVVVAAVALVVVGPAEAGRGGLATAAVAVVAGVLGARSGAGWHPTRSWPAWARAVPRAVAAALGTLLAGGAAVVVVSVLQHWRRMAELSGALGGGPLAGFLLGAVQLAYAPVLILWGVAWLLGPGFTLGPDSLVSMADTHLGLLPGLPVFGAVPAPGPGRPVLVVWLLVAIAAGAVAGWVVVAARRRARADETGLVGGLAGVLAGFATVALAALSRGDLGSLRLAGMGPRLPELLVLAPSVLGLAGMGAGLLLGVLRPPLPEGEDPEVAEETRPIRRR